MRTGKLVPPNLALVVARLELCSLIASPGRFPELGPVILAACVRHRACGVSLAMAELRRAMSVQEGVSQSQSRTRSSNTISRTP